MDRNKSGFYEDVINDLNILLVDIHCKLQEDNLDLKDLQKLHLELKNAKTTVDTLIFFYNKLVKLSLYIGKLYKKATRTNVQNYFSDEIIKLNIIKGNIRRKQQLLSKLLCEYAYGKVKNERIYPVFYLADEKIIEYIYNDNNMLKNAIMMEKIAMVELLQRYLNSETEDLIQLLEAAKAAEIDRHFSFDEKLKALNEFINSDEEQTLIKAMKVLK